MDRFTVAGVAWRLAVGVVSVVVGVGISMGGFAVAQWWFDQPAPASVHVECDDDGDYEYSRGDDDVFVNDAGDTCVKSTTEQTQTQASVWGWPTAVAMPVHLVVVVVVVVLTVGAWVLAFLGAVVPWTEDSDSESDLCVFDGHHVCRGGRRIRVSSRGKE